MKDNTLNYVKYLLEQNSIKKGFNLEALCSHDEISKDKTNTILRQGRLMEYAPIFSCHQVKSNK